MRVYDNSSLHEMHELLQQMKELHAPDRCEGQLNDIWQGIQKLRGSETPQEKIEKYWNANSKNHKRDLKMLTELDMTARDQLWHICEDVDSTRHPTVAKVQLDAFIEGCDAYQLQKMFDIMIVQWVWRDRLIETWKIK